MGSQLTITQLISEIGKGDLILPEFQRGYVWNREQVKGYLDSLYRGYPTGSFLLWKTPNPGLVRGGDGEAKGLFQLILDGQQRLTSVYTLINGEPPPFFEGEKLDLPLWFNVLSEEFSYYKPSIMKGALEWVPVTPFLKAGIGNYLSNGGPVSPQQREYLLAQFNRLNRLDSVRSYTYYLDILGEREMDEVVRIFNLVNSKGTPLNKSDLALSHICANWPEARQVLRDEEAALSAHGFAFDLNLLVRCLAAVATGSGKLEPLYKIPITDIREAWERTRRSLDHLVNVLKADAFMESSGSLTSQNVVIPLVVFLASHGCKFSTETEKRHFLHWMFAAIMWSRYSGPAETRLTQDIQALSAPEPTRRLLENIIADRGRLKVEGRDLIGASWRTGWASVAYAVARSRSARDWSNGAAIHGNLAGKENVVEYHHIFPQNLLYRPKGRYDPTVAADVQRVNEIANIAYLTSGSNKGISSKLPADYLPKVDEKFPGALAQQSVPMTPALWEVGRFEDFLAKRRETLATAINGFMDHLVHGEKIATLTIDDYVKAGEGPAVEFKSSMRWDWKLGEVNKTLEKVIMRTLAGFLNADGGTLLVGVEDDGAVCGVEADLDTLSPKSTDRWELHLRNILNGALGKEIAALVEVTFVEASGHTVALLRVDSYVKPVFLTDGNATEFHIRAGNTTLLLNVAEAADYISHHFGPLG